MIIHIHEDDWGMRSLYPIEGWLDAEKDMRLAQTSEPERRAPDGVGWTDLHIIQEPETNYTHVGLSCLSVKEALDGLMPAVTKFYATASCGFTSKERDPYGSYEDDAVCYGFGSHCFIKIDPKKDLVANIWYEASTSSPEHLAALQTAMKAINALHPSIIVDYWLKLSGAISDETFLENYMNQL